MDYSAFTLIIDGEVDRPARLRWDEIEPMLSQQKPAHIECLGAGSRGEREMRGVPIMDLLELAAARDHATSAVFLCADGYSENFSLLELLEYQAYLGHMVEEGADYPLRLIVPGKQGIRLAKWVREMRIVAGDGSGQWDQTSSAGAVPPAEGFAAFTSPMSCNLFVSAKKRWWRAPQAG